MAEQEIYLTPAGLRKLQEDLVYLKTVRWREVASSMRDALFSGGSWENPDYEISKMELAYIERRIQILENLLGNAKVIDGQEISTDQVRVGHLVRIRDMDTGEEMEFTIVGSVEADPAASRISHRSPVAQALLGRKVGELVNVDAPAGQFVYKILSISNETL
ncbi:MAG: transcription elongation factor GreA [Firmicutes bacterium]|nr:transcription elongation factor GreA [Bacillota bacterium]